MTGSCPAITDGAFLESALGFVDCQAQSIGAQGYQALAAPGSPVSLALTAMLTIFVAFFGYRMLFGQVPGVRDGVLAVVKIGIVLALATSWAAYRTVIYDVTFHAPAELAAGVGGAAAVPGTNGRMAERLGRVDDAFLELGRLGSGPGQFGTVNRFQSVNGQNVLIAVPAGESPNIFSSFALGTARLVFLIATVAGFASVRLVAGLLLALGPLFVAFLLFEGTRGLFEGWIRGLAAAALGALTVSILIGVELALLEPWLTSLIALRQAEMPIGGAPTELLVVAFSFAFVLVAGLGMASRVALGFRLPANWREAPARLFTTIGRDQLLTRPAGIGGSAHVPSEQHSRAAAVSEAVATAQRREAAQAVGGGAPPRAAIAMPGRDATPSAPTPLGQGHRRRTQSRISASAGRRDSKR